MHWIYSLVWWEGASSHLFISPNFHPLPYHHDLLLCYLLSCLTLKLGGTFNLALSLCPNDNHEGLLILLIVLSGTQLMAITAYQQDPANITHRSAWEAAFANLTPTHLAWHPLAQGEFPVALTWHIQVHHLALLHLLGCIFQYPLPLPFPESLPTPWMSWGPLLMHPSCPVHGTGHIM